MDNYPTAVSAGRQAGMKSVGILFAKWTKSYFSHNLTYCSYEKFLQSRNLGKFVRIFLITAVI